MHRDDAPDDTNESESADPSLSDRVEASDDFRAALEQSTGLAVQYRRIVLVLVLLSLLIAVYLLASRFVF